MEVRMMRKWRAAGLAILMSAGFVVWALTGRGEQVVESEENAA